MSDFQLWDKVRVSKGRLKGETGTLIGETNLNMDHRLIVRRDNPRARAGYKTMGFHKDELCLKDK